MNWRSRDHHNIRRYQRIAPGKKHPRRFRRSSTRCHATSRWECAVRRMWSHSTRSNCTCRSPAMMRVTLRARKWREAPGRPQHSGEETQQLPSRVRLCMQRTEKINPSDQQLAAFVLLKHTTVAQLSRPALCVCFAATPLSCARVRSSLLVMRLRASERASKRERSGRWSQTQERDSQ